ncbi:hypothetical protein GCM10011354_04820 [Egicoccus halophilus]|uniref:Response regulatory domain-containing protein n=1 Tax=Egicoccus halophilus TaxID=1670830 RepID=A0A8J3EWG4_9ACTN|nr:hypothetical protein GCM10011354_04820 [Egicoccus halophilus]
METDRYPDAGRPVAERSARVPQHQTGGPARGTSVGSATFWSSDRRSDHERAHTISSLGPFVHASSELPRLVVVDDDRTIRDVVSLTLRSSGQIEVVGLAADGAEAMQMVADEQPDVVLLDLMLGAERGTDLIAPLLRSAPRSMIAMMTSVPAELEELNSLRAGAFVYYEKTMLSALARFIADDLSLFRRALGGEDVVAPSSLRRRSEPTGT